MWISHFYICPIIAEQGIGYDQRRDTYNIHYYLVWDCCLRLPHEIPCGRRFFYSHQADDFMQVLPETISEGE